LASVEGEDNDLVSIDRCIEQSTHCLNKLKTKLQEIIHSHTCLQKTSTDPTWLQHKHNS